MLTPVAAEILEIAIPLQLTFRHALAARSFSDSVVVRITDSAGNAGHGECAPRDYVTDETTASVRDALARMLPTFLSSHFASLDGLREALTASARTLARNEHAAFCALELALLDLGGRVYGVSAGSVLGPVLHPRVRYSGVASADGPDAVRKACEKMRQFGLGSVKLKVGHSLDEDLAILRAARAALGEECSLRVDANCAWTKHEAFERIEAFAEFRLDGLEQPVAADDLDAMEAITAASPIPIIADESLASAADAEQLAARNACHLFNIRVSKCGGLMNSWRIRDIGRNAGIGCMLGAQVGETALLSASGRQFATRVPDVHLCEGSYGRLLLTEDISVEDLTFGPGGYALALRGPGLGVDIDEARLRRHCVHSTKVSPG